MRKEIKVLFIKVACQSQLLSRVIMTVIYMCIGYLIMIEIFQHVHVLGQHRGGIKALHVRPGGMKAVVGIGVALGEHLHILALQP